MQASGNVHAVMRMGTQAAAPHAPRRAALPPVAGAFNAAFCEIAGLAILVKPELFDTVTESDYLAAMAEASLTVDEFVWLKVRVVVLRAVVHMCKIPIPDTRSVVVGPAGRVSGGVRRW